MSKKLAVLIGALVTAASGGAIALVNYFEPANMGAITSAIDVASGAAITIVNLFVAPKVVESLSKKEDKKAE